MDALIIKNKEIKKIKATESFHNFPVPNIKTNLKNEKQKKSKSDTKKKKYLDNILSKNFTEQYFKKKELKIKNQKLNTK